MSPTSTPPTRTVLSTTTEESSPRQVQYLLSLQFSCHTLSVLAAGTMLMRMALTLSVQPNPPRDERSIGHSLRLISIVLARPVRSLGISIVLCLCSGNGIQCRLRLTKSSPWGPRSQFMPNHRHRGRNGGPRLLQSRW